MQSQRTDRSPTDRSLLLGVVAAAAATSFGLLAAAVARRDTSAVDEAVHKKTAPPERHQVRRAARAMAPVGKWWNYVPAGVGIGAWLITASRSDDGRRRAIGGAAAIVTAGVAATALSPLFDRWLPQRPAPPGHPSKWKPVFPSGHAFGPASVALTAAYVMAREELAPAKVTMPLALTIPLLLSGSRLLLEKHWVSDVAGGYLAAFAVAAACLVPYERKRVRRSSPRSGLPPRRDRAATAA